MGKLAQSGSETFRKLLQPNGVQAIIFDLDGTLRYDRPASTQAFLDYAVALGLPGIPEARREAMRWTHYYWAQSRELAEDLSTYQGQEPEFWLNFTVRCLKAFGCPEARTSELAHLVHSYMAEEHRPVEYVPDDIPTTLQDLKEAGFRLAVLSNRNQPCQEVLDRLGLGKYFEVVLVAGELECWKPDPEIFRRALQRLDLRPEQAVYVGDNYYADIVGARRAGLHPVLIDPDDIFPDPGCPSIRNLSELPDVL